MKHIAIYKTGILLAINIGQGYIMPVYTPENVALLFTKSVNIHILIQKTVLYKEQTRSRSILKQPLHHQKTKKEKPIYLQIPNLMRATCWYKNSIP